MIARVVCIAALLASGCAANRGAVAQRSAKLSRAVRRGDADDVRAMMLPATVATVDTETLLAKSARKQSGTGDELESLSKEELYERAQAADLPGRSGMSKRQLIAALRKAG